MAALAMLKFIFTAAIAHICTKFDDSDEIQYGGGPNFEIHFVLVMAQ